MLSRIFVAAVLLAILTSTAPAHAAVVFDAVTEAVNITFANGYTLTGELNYDFFDSPTIFYGFPHPGPTGLFLNGADLFSTNGAPDGESINGVWANPGNIPGHGSGPGATADLYAVLADLPNNLTVGDFFLNGTPFVFTDGIPGVSGSVECVNGCGATPLPAALPLFGSGVMMLAGFAWRSRGKPC
jgi:hypothetical protein